jgi:ubiquinone/menaquinone biosynthesis C-methylase UbiE
MPTPPRVADVFDALATTYDQTGMPFFRPAGSRLVERLAPQRGDRALDIGCGRGAATVPLAEAVGPEGSVLAIDVSPNMVAATRALVDDAGLGQVRVEVADAGDLGPRGPFDALTASLVLFFLPDPAAALTSWLSLVADGGRLGVTTFGELDEASYALDDLLEPYAPPGLLDPRTSGEAGPFSSADATRALFHSCGAEVQLTTEAFTMPFADVAAWERFSRTTGQSAMWRCVPDADLPRVRAQAAEILDGPLVWEVRFWIASQVSS